MHVMQSFKIFMYFLWRDLYVQGHKLKDWIINWWLFYPLINVASNLYLGTNTYFGQGHQTLGTMIFAGQILLMTMVLTYKLSISTLFDLTSHKFINYQITLLNPNLVIFERIVFTALFSFVLLAPYYPIAKLIGRSALDTTHTQWLALFLVLLFACMCCAAYHQMVSLVLKGPQQIGSLWARVNITLFTLGGFIIPWYIMNEYSPTLGYITRLNPMLYISEGMRKAIIGGEHFTPIWICCSVLFAYSVVFTLLAFVVFKKRTDHI